jgi:hypothetical protein
MIRKTQILAAAVASAFAAPAFAQSIDAFAVEHFNAGVSVADQQVVVDGASDPSLDAMAAAKFNHNARRDEVQIIAVSARDVTGSDYGQLAASAGADGSASLDAIAAAKFLKDQTQTDN